MNYEMFKTSKLQSFVLFCCLLKLQYIVRARGRKSFTTGYGKPVFSVFNRTNTGI